MPPRPPDNQLTPAQQAFLEYVAGFIAENGQAPTTREIQGALGLRSPRSVSQYLDALQRTGYISRLSETKRSARNIRLLRHPPGPAAAGGTTTALVPVLGSVPAGSPVLAEEHAVGQIAVSEELVPPGAAYFALRVAGDSMNEADINDGDLVLVRQQFNAKDRDIVVALVDGDVTVKRFRSGRGAAVLEPVSSNPAHRPIIVGPSFRVQGCVVAVLPVDATT